VSLRLSWASAGLAGRQWGLLLGPVLIILGHVAWLGSCAFAVVRAARKAPNNDLGRIALGAFFSTAVCPVCTPALVILLGAAAAIASPLFGAVLLLAFSLGRAIPIALGAWAAGLAGEPQHPEQIPKRFRDSRGRDAYRIRPLHAERILFLDTVARDMRWPQ